MIDYSKYPWLCPTTCHGYTCSNENNGSLVSEQEGYNAESFTTESYGTYGLQGVYYKVYEDLERDKIYGEDQLAVIQRAFNFLLYTEHIPPNVRSYHLQGIMGDDIVTCYVGVTAFKYWSTYGNTDRNTPLIYQDFTPRIGDIVYLKANDTFYEIRDVKYYQEAFGLTSHTYTLTMKVYKGSKLTIDTENPTLMDTSDPIYNVATSGFAEQYEINDPLKKNELLDGDNLYHSTNVNHMDVLYDPERHAYDRYRRLQEEIEAEGKALEDLVDNYDLGLDDFEEDLNKTKEDVEELVDKTDELEDEIEHIKDNSTSYEYIDEETKRRRRD